MESRTQLKKKSKKYQNQVINWFMLFVMVSTFFAIVSIALIERGKPGLEQRIEQRALWKHLDCKMKNCCYGNK